MTGQPRRVALLLSGVGQALFFQAGEFLFYGRAPQHRITRWPGRRRQSAFHRLLPDQRTHFDIAQQPAGIHLHFDPDIPFRAAARVF
ncbi:hypothetical protein Dda3937_02611 [Dickeya dadantii 3937]|uniref:Uncharacterized protein n=1 Tax=Dickeya dadantii (strain 3937) TaxID=198628 RepID=E0SEE5_DICD3|nr:hypothetical protein Dda3937_02611 [Dickeya dadantii 3937]